MKKKFLIFLAIACSVIFAACGSSANSSSAAYYDNAAAEAVYTEEAYEAPAEMSTGASGKTAASADQESGSGKPYNGDVKLIYRANMSAETTDIDGAMAEIEQLVKDMGGYVESSDVTNHSYSNNTYRYAYYTVRIPSEKYEAFLDTFSKSGAATVTSISRSVTDIGQEYADTEARLSTLRIKQERLQNLLSQAENMEDIITIESALSEVEYEIESYSSTLNRYDSLVGFSTITINLEQVSRETKPVENTSYFERLVNSFTNGIADFVDGFGEFLIGLVGVIIPLAIVVIIIILIVKLIIKVVRKGRSEKPAKEKRKPAGRWRRKKEEAQSANEGADETAAGRQAQEPETKQEDK